MVYFTKKPANAYDGKLIKEDCTVQRKAKCSFFFLRFENLFPKETFLPSEQTNITKVFSEVGSMY